MGKYNEQLQNLLVKQNKVSSSYDHIMNNFGYLMDDIHKTFNEIIYRNNISLIQQQINDLIPLCIEERAKEEQSKMLSDFSKNVSRESEQIGKSIADGISSGFKKAGLK